jgi:hypothetical protein
MGFVFGMAGLIVLKGPGHGVALLVNCLKSNNRGTKTLLSERGVSIGGDAWWTGSSADCRSEDRQSFEGVLQEMQRQNSPRQLKLAGFRFVGCGSLHAIKYTGFWGAVKYKLDECWVSGGRALGDNLRSTTFVP